MTYRNLLEVAEAVFDGRVEFILPTLVDPWTWREFHRWTEEDAAIWFRGRGMDGDGHRMWFCLFVHEVMK